VLVLGQPWRAVKLMTRDPGCEPKSHKLRRDVLLLAILAGIFFLLLVRTAWVCDDAYITFRVVDNLVHGFGPRWNVMERVQAFTHPLWMLLVAAFYWATGDVYYTSLILSMALSFAAFLAMVLRIAASPRHGLLAAVLLIISKAYMDYSTSGLENPLTHLLLAAFCMVLFEATARPRLALRLAIVAGLSALNRMDSMLLLAPALLVAASREGPRRAVQALALSGLPMAGWMAFSLFYYGFPFPNTAYAKLNTGIPGWELAQQGFHYLLNSVTFDPVTLLAILTGLFLAFAFKSSWAKLLALGILIYLAYVVRVGGDFMGGRFLTAPFFLAVVITSRGGFVLSRHSLSLAMAALTIAAFASPASDLFSTKADFAVRAEDDEPIDNKGVTDERAMYYAGTGLLTASRAAPMPTHYFAKRGAKWRVKEEPFILHGTIGMVGFFAGPEKFVLDPLALADPFLARLPAEPGWSIGHFARALPPGYEATLRGGKNVIEDDRLAEYYDRLRLVVSGDLLDRRRLRTIWDLNLGGGSRLLDDYFTIRSTVQRVRLAEIELPRPEGTPLGAPSVRRFSHYGIEIDLGRKRRAKFIELSVDNDDTYELKCLQGDVVLRGFKVARRGVSPGGLIVHTVAVNPDTVTSGYDRIRVTPLTPFSKDRHYSLGHLGHLRLFDGLPNGPTDPEPTTQLTGGRN